MVIWTHYQPWSAKRIRAFLFAMFFLSIPAHLGLYAWRFGMPVISAGMFAVVVSPAVLLGAALGHPVGDRLDRERLRRYGLVLLVLVALKGLWPMISGRG